MNRFLDRWWKEPNILAVDFFLSSNLIEISKVSNLKRALCQQKYNHKHHLGEQATIKLKLAKALPGGFAVGEVAAATAAAAAATSGSGEEEEEREGEETEGEELGRGKEKKTGQGREYEKKSIKGEIEVVLYSTSTTMTGMPGQPCETFWN